MRNKRRFVVRVPVVIEAPDEQSFIAAKRYLRTFFHQIESGANQDNLCWKVSLGQSKLLRRDTNDE